MVGGDHVNGAVYDTLYQCFPVVGTSQRRIHFESAVFLQIIVAKNKIVRSRFTCYINSALFRFAYRLHAFSA